MQTNNTHTKTCNLNFLSILTKFQIYVSAHFSKSGEAQKSELLLVVLGCILEFFFGSFLDHFSDVFFESLLARVLVNFGATLGPKGTFKSMKNVKR